MNSGIDNLSDQIWIDEEDLMDRCNCRKQLISRIPGDRRRKGKEEKIPCGRKKSANERKVTDSK